eukprot:5634618-Heterocapsa_arctica.AAC.1
MDEFAVRGPWADTEDEPEESEAAEDTPGDINVLSESVAYARANVPLGDEDWTDETGRYLSTMTLRELLKTRRVRTMDGPLLTILPWARNLNHGR